MEIRPGISDSIHSGGLTGADSLRRIAVLDGWRGISFLSVFIAHAVNYRYLGVLPVSRLGYQFLETLSGCGVCIFFVISGYIIAKLALLEYMRDGRFSIRAFYTRRFFRIVPPFFIYLACILLFSALGWIAQRNHQTAVAAAFICNLSNADCGWFAANSWTLSYEEQFYLVFPAVISLAGLRLKWILGCLLLILCAIPLLRYKLNYGRSGIALMHAAFYLSFICIGTLVAALGETGKRLFTIRLAGCVSTCAAVMLLMLALLDAAVRVPHVSPLLDRARVFVPLLEPLCIAWLVGSSVYQSNWGTRLLVWRPLTVIGTFSYSLYLWQQVFTAPAADYPVRSWLLFPPFLILCAVLSYYFVERPCMGIARRILRPRLQTLPAH
jgi:peptidoglycan/LPS O-acetylase OafA/YrhL